MSRNSSSLYFALQKIGAIPIAALDTHRYNEVSQFVAIGRAVSCIYPERQSDFAFGPMIRRVAAENPCLKFPIVLGTPAAGELSLTDLIERPAKLPQAELDKIAIDPTDPCIFQLSGGTTGDSQAHSRARTTTTPIIRRLRHRYAASTATRCCC